MTRPRIVGVVLLVSLALAGGILFARVRAPAVALELRAGTVLPDRHPIGQFQLTDQHGQALTRERFRGRWSLVFAGFTQCPDVCPTTLVLLDALDAKLRAAGGSLQTVFLSVDPERDTADRLAAYLGHFNAGFVGATGARDQVDALCRDLGIAHVRNPGVAGDYTVDHSAALVLVDPRARVAGYFRPPFDVARLAADLAPLAAAAGS